MLKRIRIISSIITLSLVITALVSKLLTLGIIAWCAIMITIMSICACGLIDSSISRQSEDIHLEESNVNLGGNSRSLSRFPSIGLKTRIIAWCLFSMGILLLSKLIGMEECFAYFIISYSLFLFLVYPALAYRIDGKQKSTKSNDQSEESDEVE